MFKHLYTILNSIMSKYITLKLSFNQTMYFRKILDDTNTLADTKMMFKYPIEEAKSVFIFEGVYPLQREFSTDLLESLKNTVEEGLHQYLHVPEYYEVE